MSASGKQFPLIPVLLVLFGILLIVLVFLGAANCQTPPAQPQGFGVAYLVPRQGLLPTIRYRWFGKVPYDLYVPVGQPFQATVQPVVPWRPR